MATFEFSARRLIIAGGFALAVAAAPVISAVAMPAAGTSAPVAACPSGEEEDQFTGVCVPHTVPNSPFSTVPGNPDVPTIGGIPCIGRQASECAGLAQVQPPAFQQPKTSISSSP